jgi:aminocarboxymuconate-semialdehyde decarboxylase
LVVHEFLNDDLAKTCDDYPDHFVGLGCVPLQDPKLAIKEGNYLFF